MMLMEEDCFPIHACEDHINVAIDDFIEEYETFPILTKGNKAFCSYCDKEALYSLQVPYKNI